MMSAPLEENQAEELSFALADDSDHETDDQLLEDRKTGSLLENSHMSPAKPWEYGEGGTHRALRLASHGAGGELADSSSTTTSVPHDPDRWMMPVKREEGLFSADGEVGYNNVTDDKISVRSSHSHWCTICEHPKMISTCDDWKRHMKEHEQVWLCNICARKDSAFTRRSHLARHLSSSHGYPGNDARFLADKGECNESKKAYACGFCIETFRILSDQLNHIDQEHWRRGQNISEWDLNKVIHGLLIQPNILSSWCNLLRDTSSVIRDLTWNTSKAVSLIRRLELSEEPADDLAAAAISQLTPVHISPIADSYRNPMDSINRPQLEPFQRVADIACDSSSDAESVESGVDSVASSRTSVVPDKFSLLAADELVACLLQDAELGIIYKIALGSRHVGADRFERNFRRILNQYSRDLKKEARDRGQTSAAVLVRRRSKYIANTLRQRLEGPRRSYTHDHILHGEDRGTLNIMKIEQYLSSMKGSLSSSSPDEPYIRDEPLVELSSSDTDTSDDDLDDKLPVLSQIKDFMFTSKAFLALRATVWQLVDPSLKLNLGRLTSEIECCRPTPIDVSHEAVESISDQIKGVIEDFTRSSWDWWPLKPRMGHIPPGYARIRWCCVGALTCHVARANRTSLVARSVAKTSQCFMQSRSLGLRPVPLTLQLCSMWSKELVKVDLPVMVRPVIRQYRLQRLTAGTPANTRIILLNMILLSSKRSV